VAVDSARPGLITVPSSDTAFRRQVDAVWARSAIKGPEDLERRLRRLFPRAYDDEQDEAAYRELMGNELAEGRNRALQVLSETATAERLNGEQAQAWLTALNDLRLVLGTRLDVTDESLLEGLSENDPRAPELALYAYLSWLQEQLVEALSAEL
jgi:hypothetical protein